MSRFNATLKTIEASYQKLDPSSVLGREVGLQERKSAQMRLQILEATTNSLAVNGYANTTTQLVAQASKISRGALLHHYSTRTHLIDATADFISTRTLRNYIAEVKQLSDKERKQDGSGVEVFWNLTKSVESQAWRVLSSASRTDPELKEIFLPKAKRHDKLVLSILPEIFPEWANTDPSDIQLAHDLINVMVIGLDAHQDVMSSKRRRVALRKYVFDAVQLIREVDNE